MVAIELLKVPSYGSGKVVHPTEGRCQRLLGVACSVALGANVSGARVLGPELVHRAHQNF